ALPARTGRGISLHDSFGSYVALVIEAHVTTSGEVQLKRAVAAVDCGLNVNPNSVAAQIEGGAIFGLSAALFNGITLADGRVEQSNFNDYRQIRINEVPPFEVHIVKSGEDPGGVGECGTVSAAPALGNAIFAATGRRLRKLPFDRASLADNGSDKTVSAAIPLGVGLSLGLATLGSRPVDDATAPVAACPSAVG
ncbi:MAG: molybdopterin cofactor-binding domain-containing protein, partial [Janthinobacterium lividum]